MYVLLLTHIVHPRRDASKPTRNGIVHPMFHLAVIASTFSCADAIVLIEKMRTYRVEEETRTEMIQIVKGETQGCDWDAKAD